MNNIQGDAFVTNICALIVLSSATRTSDSSLRNSAQRGPSENKSRQKTTFQEVNLFHNFIPH